MTMISMKSKFLILIFSFVLSSCETLQDFAGLSKPNLEKDLIDQTPDLILPPDFNRTARKSNNIQRQSEQRSLEPNISYQEGVQSIQPRVTNFIAPQIKVESSPTPSDSLERFKENKKFTIGQWVYGQYVQGFKQGNLYYRPIYDKGYNFSRRYLPDQNVSSFLAPPQINSDSYNYSMPNQENSSDIRNLDNLPIID